MKANWVVHILRRNCLREHVIEDDVRYQLDATIMIY